MGWCNTAKTMTVSCLGSGNDLGQVQPKFKQTRARLGPDQDEVCLRSVWDEAQSTFRPCGAFNGAM